MNAADNRAYVVHRDDNVATALDDLAVSTARLVGEIRGRRECLEVREAFGSGHKVALTGIPEGQAVIKFGIRIGRGSVIGSPIAPLLKITGNAQTYRHMQEDMDFDASPVLTGATTLEDRTDALCREVVRTASGRPSKPEALGHREYFIMYKHQDAPGLLQGCRA